MKQFYLLDMSGYIISIHKSRLAAHKALVKATCDGIRFLRTGEGYGKRAGEQA